MPFNFCFIKSLFAKYLHNKTIYNYNQQLTDIHSVRFRLGTKCSVITRLVEVTVEGVIDFRISVGAASTARCR